MGIFLDLEAAFDWVGYSGLSCWLLRQLPHDFPPAALTALRQWLLWVSGPSPLLALHILGSLCHPHVPSTQLGTSSLLLFSELQTRYPTASWWLLLNDLQDPPPQTHFEQHRDVDLFQKTLLFHVRIRTSTSWIVTWYLPLPLFPHSIHH